MPEHRRRARIAAGGHDLCGETSNAMRRTLKASMSSDVTTLEAQAHVGALEAPPRRLRRAKASAWASSPTAAAVALGVIVLCSILTVLVASNRSSFLSATTRAHFFPGWIAGPLGGLLPFFSPSESALKLMFTFAVIAMYGSYLFGLERIPKLGARTVIAAIVLLQLAFLLSPPLTLTDVFNYIDYARMDVVHNLNPYATIPALEPHRDPAYALSNWHELLSPYGPLFTIFTFVAVPFGIAVSFWLVKGALALFSLGCLTLVWKCAQLLGRNPVKAILYAGLNPIVLLWGLGGDHNDLVMMFFILLALYLLLRAGAMSDEVGNGARSGLPDTPLATTASGLPDTPLATTANGDPDTPLATTANGLPDTPLATTVNGLPDTPFTRTASGPPGTLVRLRAWMLPLSGLQIAAGFSLAAAVFVKASAGIVVPVILVGLARSPRRAVQTVVGGILGAVVLGLLSFLVFGVHIPDLGTQGSIVTDMSLPNLLGLLLGQGGETETLRLLLSVALIVAVGCCCLLAWRSGDIIGASGWASIALLVTLAWVLPWYVAWVLPLAALSRSRRLRIATVALSVYLIVVWAPSSPTIWNAIGFQPGNTPLGQLHHRYVKELLN